MPFDSLSEQPERDPILHTLLRTRELLEKGWCQGSMARNARGDSVPPDSAAVASLCVAGAVYKASPGCGVYSGACLWIADAIGGEETLSAYNDTHTKSEVLAVVDKAIEARRAHRAARVEA